LETGDLARARAAADAAEKFDLPLQNHIFRTLLGVVALRQGDRDMAQSALGRAIADAERTLKYNPHCFRALDCLGVALAALECCAGTHNIGPAVAAHRKARKINGDAGVLARVLRLYDVLAPADPRGALAPVRVAAGSRQAERL